MNNFTFALYTIHSNFSSSLCCAVELRLGHTTHTPFTFHYCARTYINKNRILLQVAKAAENVRHYSAWLGNSLLIKHYSKVGIQNSRHNTWLMSDFLLGLWFVLFMFPSVLTELPHKRKSGNAVIIHSQTSGINFMK